MAQPSYGAFTAQPNDYSLELADIERRKKLAQALQEQGMQPSGGTEMVGGWAIPKSPLEGIGKAAQQVSGAYQQKQLLAEQKAIADKLREQGQQDVPNFVNALQGTPAQNFPTQANEMGDEAAQQNVPAVAGDRQEALAIALRSQNPMLQGAGSSLLAEMLKPTEGAFAKINPHDYTPDSVKLFMASGGKDFSALKPREKIITDNLGGTTSYRGEYSAAPISSAPNTIKPDTAANIAWKQYEWNNLSPKDKAQLQNDAAKIGISGQELYFNTGQSGGSAFKVPQGVPPAFQMPGAGIAPAAAGVPVGQPQGQPVPQAQPVAAPQQPQPVRVNAPQQAAPVPVSNPQRVTPNDGLTPAARVALSKENALKAQDLARNLPQVINNADLAIKTIDQMLGTQGKKLQPGEENIPAHKGFNDLVGAPVMSNLRHIAGTDAADFQKYLDQVKGGAFMQAYQSLKGGGQITEIEGEKATAAITRMDRAQSKPEFIKAAREYQDVLRRGVEVAKAQAAGKTGIGKGGSGEWSGEDRRAGAGQSDYDANGNRIKR